VVHKKQIQSSLLQHFIDCTVIQIKKDQISPIQIYDNRSLIDLTN